MTVLDISVPALYVSVSQTALNRGYAVIHRLKRIEKNPYKYSKVSWPPEVRRIRTVCGRRIDAIPLELCWQRPTDCEQCLKTKISSTIVGIFFYDYQRIDRKWVVKKWLQHGKDPLKNIPGSPSLPGVLDE